MFNAEKQPATPPKQDLPTTLSDLGKLRQTGTNVTLPRLLSSVAPQYSSEAQENRFRGKCSISMIVDQNGDPAHIRTIRPLGMELGKNAVIAVSQYRFSPAKVSDQPVAVQIQIEVSFNIY